MGAGGRRGRRGAGGEELPPVGGRCPPQHGATDVLPRGAGGCRTRADGPCPHARRRPRRRRRRPRRRAPERGRGVRRGRGWRGRRRVSPPPPGWGRAERAGMVPPPGDRGRRGAHRGAHNSHSPRAPLGRGGFPPEAAGPGSRACIQVGRVRRRLLLLRRAPCTRPQSAPRPGCRRDRRVVVGEGGGCRGGGLSIGSRYSACGPPLRARPAPRACRGKARGGRIPKGGGQGRASVLRGLRGRQSRGTPLSRWRW